MNQIQSRILVKCQYSWTLGIRAPYKCSNRSLDKRIFRTTNKWIRHKMLHFFSEDFIIQMVFVSISIMKYLLLERNTPYKSKSWISTFKIFVHIKENLKNFVLKMEEKVWLNLLKSCQGHSDLNSLMIKFMIKFNNVIQLLAININFIGDDSIRVDTESLHSLRLEKIKMKGL